MPRPDEKPVTVDDVLTCMKIQRAAPSRTYLDALLLAWSKAVPWESVSRIARHRQPGAAVEYAWWPDQFFTSFLGHGTGGTCFESNFAFKALLDALGFAATLHFCDMERSSTANPHSALIVWMNDDSLYMADVGYPVPGALRLVQGGKTRVETPVYTYSATWVKEGRWRIDRKSGDFEQRSFVLKNEVVPISHFRQRLVADHEPDGLFLDEVIIQKVTGDDEIMRWSSTTGLVRRTLGQQEAVTLTQVELPVALSNIFGIDTQIIQQALEV